MVEGGTAHGLEQSSAMSPRGAPSPYIKEGEEEGAGQEGRRALGGANLLQVGLAPLSY